MGGRLLSPSLSNFNVSVYQSNVPLSMRKKAKERLLKDSPFIILSFYQNNELASVMRLLLYSLRCGVAR